MSPALNSFHKMLHEAESIQDHIPSFQMAYHLVLYGGFWLWLTFEHLFRAPVGLWDRYLELSCKSAIL